MRYLLSLLLLATVLLAEHPHLAASRGAQKLLGPAVWSRVLQIENSNSTSEYAPVVYALVFEFADILWFYTPANGTQSFSRYKGRLERDKADLGPGLQAIDSGFFRFSVVNDTSDITPSVAAPALPNACFITSVVAGWQSFSGGERILNAKLLMYHVSTKATGHCVFIYETPRGVYCVDTDLGPRPRRLKRPYGAAAVELALASSSDIRRDELRSAKVLVFPRPSTIEAPGAAVSLAARDRAVDGVLDNRG